MKHFFSIFIGSLVVCTSLWANGQTSNAIDEYKETIIMMMNDDWRRTVDGNGKYYVKDRSFNKAILLTKNEEKSKVKPALYDLEGGRSRGKWTIAIHSNNFKPRRSKYVKNVPASFTYFQQLRKRPTHYIYQVGIASKVHYKKAIGEFAKQGFRLYKLQRPRDYEWLPYVRVNSEQVVHNDENTNKSWQYYWEAIYRLEDMKIKQIKQILAKEGFYLKEAHSIGASYSTKGDVMRNERYKLYFPQGTDIKKVIDVLYKNGGLGLQIKEMYDPPVYFLQLFHPSGSLKKVQKLVQKKFKYVKLVTKY